MHVIRWGLERVRHMGLVARFSIVGLTVGVLVAGTMAWFIETQLTDLLLTNVAARASDQVERLGLTGYITRPTSRLRTLPSDWRPSRPVSTPCLRTCTIASPA